MAVLAGEASDRTRLQRTALFPEDSNLARCCFAVTAVSCEAGGEKSAQRLVEDDCHPNRLHESSFQFTSPFCLISVSWKNQPEEWAAAILCAEGLIVSSLQSRNSVLAPEFLFSRCLPQSFQPICSWRKRDGTCQRLSAPRFPTSKELVPQLLQWSCDQCQHRQHISVGGFRVSLPILCDLSQLERPPHGRLRFSTDDPLDPWH